jgi:glycosyltransferase involved in cell wall biosynthesis
MLLSIVIPCYKEGDILIPSVEKLINTINNSYFIDGEYEIILVIEKSPDNTLEKAMELSKKYYFIKILENDDAYGKGYSVKRGILYSVGKYILTVDADLPINLKKYLEIMFVLIKHDETGAVYTTDLWDKIDFRKRNKFRAFITLMLFFLRKFILKQDVSETQLGCKLYKRDIIKKCAARINVNNFLYEIYLTDLIFIEGYNIEECSVKIERFSEKSTVRIKSVFDSFLTFMKYAVYERKKLGIITKRKKNIFQKKPIYKYIKALFTVSIIVLLVLTFPFFQKLVLAANKNFKLKIIENKKQEVIIEKNLTKNSIGSYSNKNTHPSNGNINGNGNGNNKGNSKGNGNNKGNSKGNAYGKTK